MSSYFSPFSVFILNSMIRSGLNCRIAVEKAFLEPYNKKVVRGGEEGSVGVSIMWGEGGMDSNGCGVYYFVGVGVEGGETEAHCNRYGFSAYRNHLLAPSAFSGSQLPLLIRGVFDFFDALVRERAQGTHLTLTTASK